MGKLKENLLLASFVAVCVYLLGSFIQLSFLVSNWSETAREISAFIVGLSTLIFMVRYMVKSKL